MNLGSEEGLCGTHMRGTPNGMLPTGNTRSPAQQRIEVRVQDIGGINYYLDDAHNVYDPRDVVGRRPVPRVVGKWATNDLGEVCIPTLGI